MRTAVGVLVAVALAVVVFTAVSTGGQRHMGGEYGPMMHERGQRMMEAMPMMGGMMGGMMHRQVVALEDGGVVVAMGNMLFKYDEDLELVKKVELQVSDQDMQQMMQRRRRHWHMWDQMMGEEEEED